MLTAKHDYVIIKSRSKQSKAGGRMHLAPSTPGPKNQADGPADRRMQPRYRGESRAGRGRWLKV